MASNIDVDNTLSKPYVLPCFLKTKEEWNNVVKQVTTFERFDALMLLALKDENLSMEDFIPFMKDIANDILAEHGDPAIIDLVYSLEELDRLMVKWQNDRRERIRSAGGYDWLNKTFEG